MDEEVRRLRTALEDAEKLGEEVLVIKQRLIDNDRERNKTREAMAALRRMQRAQAEKEKQQELAERERGKSLASQRLLQTEKLKEEEKPKKRPTPAEPMLKEVSVSRFSEEAPTKNLEDSSSGTHSRVSSSQISTQQLPEVKQRTRPLIEELPASGLELRQETITTSHAQKSGGSEVSADVACPHCGRGTPAREAAGDASNARQGKGLGDTWGRSQLGQQQQRRSDWQNLMWMAFPVSGPADGNTAPGVFFMAPRSVVQEQLSRDLAFLDSNANELREKQKTCVQELSERGGLESDGSLVKALTTLRDRK